MNRRIRVLRCLVLMVPGLIAGMWGRTIGFCLCRISLIIPVLGTGSIFLPLVVSPLSLVVTRAMAIGCAVLSSLPVRCPWCPLRVVVLWVFVRLKNGAPIPALVKLRQSLLRVQRRSLVPSLLGLKWVTMCLFVRLST